MRRAGPRTSFAHPSRGLASSRVLASTARRRPSPREGRPILAVGPPMSTPRVEGQPSLFQKRFLAP